VLIANHYRGKQQAEAVGWLGSAQAIAGVLAFIIVGTVATLLSWRLAFGLLIVHAAAILLLSLKLKPSEARRAVGIDVVGVMLLFNVLVTAAPKEMAAGVGSLRGVTQNLAAAVGTAVVGALLVGLLTSMIVSSVASNPVISAELNDEVNLTKLNFLSDAQL
jgi:MFS family permease